MGDLFDGYGGSVRGLTGAAFDEMVARDGTVGAPYAGVASSLAQMGPEDVSRRASRLARAFMDQGVTFDLDGEERPWTGRWWGCDPTNDCPVGERHVAVGRGRD